MQRLTLLQFASLAAMLALAAPLCAQPTSRDTAFHIINLDALNSQGDDYAPFVTANDRWLYFTSNRSRSADVYRCTADGDSWSAPQLLPNDEINSPLDEGSLSAPVPRQKLLFSLSDDDLARLSFTDVAVLTASDRTHGLGDADIQAVVLDSNGSSLHDLRPLHELNSGDWDAQATLSPDGTYIVFASNREGGEGGMDLYGATRNPDGSFSAPVNLGPEINTSGNEVSPFLSPDGRTLFFSSTGHSGFGGADIFSSRRGVDGRWGPAKNLGSQINTKYNEVFFFFGDRSHCYFSSDRPGGKGGLDLYMGGPNIFVDAYSVIRVQLLDTTTGKNVAGRVAVKETSLSRTIGDVDALSGVASFQVLDGLDYSVAADAPGYDRPLPVTVRNVALNSTVDCLIKFGSPPPPPPLADIPPIVPPPPPPPPEPPLPPAPVIFTFDVAGKVVPFFVSGYYRLNTRISLAELRRRQNSDLRDQTYITDVNRDREAFVENDNFAAQVEHLLDDFVQRCQKTYFPGFVDYLKAKSPNDPKEYIQLTVYGFADPRPIIGAYTEQPVDFLDSAGNSVTVKSWEKLDNFKLAGLRAHYSVEYFDNLFRKGRARKVYTQLLQQNLVRWRAVSGSVDDLNALTSGEDLGTKRRIVVEMRLIKEGEDADGGKKIGRGVGTP
ncbi:MAG: PD40 domain-containing protein [Bacteroidetes bacterium]|nr:PD40 domain-containing protein [Bacteroidota bacterium]